MPLRAHRVAILAATWAFAVGSAQAQPSILVSQPNADTIGKYDATSGAVVNSGFISGVSSPGMAVDANNHLFTTNVNSVGEYDAVTGAAINPAFVPPGPANFSWPALDGKNHLYVTNGSAISEYDATTGAVINAALVTGLHSTFGMVADGNNHLFLANGNANGSVFVVSEYDATTGALLNGAFVGSPNVSFPFGLALDGRGHLYVSDVTRKTVGEYDATTGSALNAVLVSDPNLHQPEGIALDSSGHLFVADGTGHVGEYNATTGAIINSSLVSSFLDQPTDVVVVTPVPEPGSLALLGAIAGFAGLVFRQRNCTKR